MTVKAKEQDRKMKERIYKDHLKELSGQDLFKMPNKSAYGQEFRISFFYFDYIFFLSFMKIYLLLAFRI